MSRCKTTKAKYKTVNYLICMSSLSYDCLETLPFSGRNRHFRYDYCKLPELQFHVVMWFIVIFCWQIPCQEILLHMAWEHFHWCQTVSSEVGWTKSRNPTLQHICVRRILIIHVFIWSVLLLKQCKPDIWNISGPYTVQLQMYVGWSFQTNEMLSIRKEQKRNKTEQNKTQK